MSEDIRNIDHDYQANLVSLKETYEEGNKETESRYNSIKENAQLVDELRNEIRTLESDKRSVKLNVTLSHKKVGELENILKSTFDPLKSYLEDSDRVAGRVKASIVKKEDYIKLKERINAAVFDVLSEVSLF